MEVHPSMRCLLNTSQMVHEEHVFFCASYIAYIRTLALNMYITSFLLLLSQFWFEVL